MKMIKHLGLLFLVGLLISSCQDKVRYEYLMNVPVYTGYESFRSVGGWEAPRSISAWGNIYYKDQYIYMVEPDKGIHFIDNQNPSAPVQTGFLNVWGATSMAIRGEVLYVNSFVDLVIYDISNKNNPVLTNRLENVFPTALPQSEGNYPYEPIDKNKGVVTSWEIKEMKTDAGEDFPTWVNPGGWGIVTLEDSQTGFNEGGATGTAGSISLFTIIDDYLYVIEEGNYLHPFELIDPTTPEQFDPIVLWADVETLFPYESYLFMGTPTGMLIYDTETPFAPAYVSSLSHARGCDPVVVQDDMAYVTVRSGGPCGGNINQLDVIDVSNIHTPLLRNSFEMKNPHGLGIDGDRLFICDGQAGLKVFDASNPAECGDELLHQFKNIEARDIIPLGNVAMVIGENGIYQYDYSNPNEMNLLSKIEF